MQAATLPPARPEPSRRLWLVPWLGLFAWHGWLTLGLFGPGDPWTALTDDRPVLSGRHPLHLYHGGLGARALRQRGAPSCYDPGFQAGYPKTPVFDSGSRPAELALLFAGGQPARAYKMGLALGVLLLPVVLLMAVLAGGLGARAGCLATLLGLAIWWGEPGQRLLAGGDLDLLLAAVFASAQAGLLVRFHRRPGLLVWLGVCLTGLATWFAQPLFAVLLLPLFLTYYFRVGPRHTALWHLALLGGLALALASNAFWLIDGVDSWWLRVGPGSGNSLLLHRTPRTVWDASFWGSELDRGVIVLVLLLALIGAAALNRNGDRAAAQSLVLGSLTLFGLALGGLLNDLLGQMHADALLVPALLLALPLAAHALDRGWQRLTAKRGPRLVLMLTPVAAAAGWVWLGSFPLPMPSYQPPPPLELGFTAEQGRVIEELRQHTTSEGRILWEDMPEAGSWPALLPWTSGRSFIGGVDPDGCIEHSACRLSNATLAGRPLTEWSDIELAAYCRRYNVGWVVAWTPATVARLQRWSLARPSCELSLDRPGRLFIIERPLGYLLKGKAKSCRLGLGSVTLSEVEPEDGEVVLSLHYQAGMTASPSRVRLERELDSHDPIPLIRLRMDGPVARITITFP